MNNKTLYTTRALILITLLTTFSIADAGTAKPPFPKYMLSLSGGWNSFGYGDIGVDVSGRVLDDPRDISNIFDPNVWNRLYKSNHPDYSGNLQLGYNIYKTMYAHVGLNYEHRDDIGDIYYLGYASWDKYRAYLKTTSIIPFVGLEYTNRVWKFVYNSSLDFAYCASRSDISYTLFDEEFSAGTFSSNSPGLIISGGLGYEIVRFTYLKAYAGYRYFDSNSLEPPNNTDVLPIEADFSGSFFGLGMDFGWGR